MDKLLFPNISMELEALAEQAILNNPKEIEPYLFTIENMKLEW